MRKQFLRNRCSSDIAKGVNGDEYARGTGPESPGQVRAGRGNHAENPSGAADRKVGDANPVGSNGLVPRYPDAAMLVAD
jgi:hypothetical protein